MSSDFELLNSCLERSDSLCSPSPQAKLLSLFESKNVDKFVEVLKNNSGRIDVNYFYEAPVNGTLLDAACRSKGNRKFVDILIQFGADVNAVNSVFEKTPLHVAVENSDTETVEGLVLCGKCDVNALDKFGNTALHIAAKGNKLNFIEILLKHPAIDINAINRKHQTPLHLALVQGSKEAIRLLLGRLDVDLDEVKDFRHRCCREIIDEEYPEFKSKMELPRMKTSDKSLNDNLFLCLRNRDLKAFLRLAKVNKHCLNENDGSRTYLQYACELGLPEVVETLVNLGVDPNGCCLNYNKPPVIIAAEKGYYDILQTLIRNGDTAFSPVGGKTVLHAIFDGMYDKGEALGLSPNEVSDHRKCLKAVLKEVPLDRLDINYADIAGNTVLHYAVQLNDNEAVKALLDAGAYIGCKNNNGKFPLEHISPTVLEEYLDACISTNDKASREPAYEIIYDYKIFTPPRTQSFYEKHGLEIDRSEIYDVVSETEPLLVMNDIPELRRLLLHPVITSFLNLKWYTIRKYFFINLIFYLTFWFALTSYILYTYGLSNNRNSTENATEPVVTNGSNSILVPDNDTLLWCITSFLCVVLFLREFVQFCISPWSYMKSPENWLEIGLVIITAAVLMCQTSLDKRPQLAACAILASWMELILLIGRHPLLSTNIEMFKTVSVNFLKFLAWYSILILAFAFSFYILFNGRSSENDIFFRDPAMSVFKSVIMLTGEFDAGSIPFGEKLSTSHLLFILFVFLVAIVLFNLLNGLAVSDTQAIRTDAELVGIVSRIKLITYVETMAVSDPFPCLSFLDKLSCCCCCAPLKEVTHKRRKHVKMFYKRINLFPYTLPDSQIRVLPNENGNVLLTDTADEYHDEESCLMKYSSWRIDPNIIKDTVKVLEKFRKQKEAINFSELIKEYTEQLQEYKSKLDTVESASERNEKLLKEIMGILKQRL